jgi:hypothetical protein
MLANFRFQKTVIVLSMILAGVVVGAVCITSQLAQAQVQGTYVTKIVVDKDSIGRGHTQTLDAFVKSMSGGPITGTVVTFTVNYADLKTTRQASVNVDGSGHASYSWTIGDNVKPGTFDVDALVSGPNFVAQSITAQSFVVHK